jgi:hypothetical protein
MHVQGNCALRGLNLLFPVPMLSWAKVSIFTDPLNLYKTPRNAECSHRQRRLKRACFHFPGREPYTKKVHSLGALRAEAFRASRLKGF